MSRTISASTSMILAVVMLVGANLAGASRIFGTPLTHDELFDKLSQRELSPAYVAGLLSKTRDQNQEGVIIGEYSVGQLVELNSLFQLSHCASEEIDRRLDICHKLRISSMGNELKNVNLFRYCFDRVTLLVDWCEKSGAGIKRPLRPLSDLDRSILLTLEQMRIEANRDIYAQDSA